MKMLIAVWGVAALILTGCASSPDDTTPSQPPSVTSAAPTPSTNLAPGSAAPSPTQPPTTGPPTVDEVVFPHGTTYWLNGIGVPVVAYSDTSQLCWYNWTGLEILQRFTGELTAAEGFLRWEGVIGHYTYPGETPLPTINLVASLTPSENGNWVVSRIDEPATGQNSFLLFDVWAPITADQASRAFLRVAGLEQTGLYYEAPVEHSCPSPADFAPTAGG